MTFVLLMSIHIIVVSYDIIPLCRQKCGKTRNNNERKSIWQNAIQRKFISQP